MEPVCLEMMLSCYMHLCYCSLFQLCLIAFCMMPPVLANETLEVIKLLTIILMVSSLSDLALAQQDVSAGLILSG